MVWHRCLHMLQPNHCREYDPNKTVVQILNHLIIVLYDYFIPLLNSNDGQNNTIGKKLWLGLYLTVAMHHVR